MGSWRSSGTWFVQITGGTKELNTVSNATVVRDLGRVRAAGRSPDSSQHLCRRAVCEAAGVRDDLRRYVTDHLRHADAVGRR